MVHTHRHTCNCSRITLFGHIWHTTAPPPSPLFFLPLPSCFHFCLVHLEETVLWGYPPLNWCWFCVAGLALGDIDVASVWQAWPLRHWACSGGAPWSACMARVALGGIHNFVTYNFVTRATPNVPLSHAQLCHTRLSHRSNFHLQLFCTIAPPPSPLSSLPFPSHSHACLILLGEDYTFFHFPDWSSRTIRNWYSCPSHPQSRLFLFVPGMYPRFNLFWSSRCFPVFAPRWFCWLPKCWWTKEIWHGSPRCQTCCFARGTNVILAFAKNGWATSMTCSRHGASGAWPRMALRPPLEAGAGTGVRTGEAIGIVLDHDFRIGAKPLK